MYKTMIKIYDNNLFELSYIDNLFRLLKEDI